MTPEEYNERLTNVYGLVSGNLAEDTILPSAIILLEEIKNRIENEGKNTDGGNIGPYSVKPLYAGQKVFIRGGFVAQGKNNYDGNTIGDRIIETNKILVNRNTVHKNNNIFIAGRQTTTSKGNGKKTARFGLVKPNYQERKTMYLKEGYKELRDVQGLRTDITNFKYSGDLLESYQSQLTVQTVLLGLTSELSAKKRAGLEAKKGRVFYASDKEISDYLARVNFSLERITRNTLQGYSVTAEIN